MAVLCLAENSPGAGGLAGGGGNDGQASGSAEGAAARSYGYPVIDIATGMTATFVLQLTQDLDGMIPSDLSDITEIFLVAKPSMYSDQHKIKVKCTKLPEQGQITFTLTPKEVDFNQGLHYVNILCYDADGVLRKNYRAWLQIRKGMTGVRVGSRYPLTIEEVRMAVMDTSPAANELLDDLEFSDVQIASCIDRAVAQWNETSPCIQPFYTPTTFPFREYLLKGAVGYLLEMVAYRYTRNRMRHSMQGLTYDDNEKGPEYVEMARRQKQEYSAWLAVKKTEINFFSAAGFVDRPQFDMYIYGDDYYW